MAQPSAAFLPGVPSDSSQAGREGVKPTQSSQDWELSVSAALAIQEVHSARAPSKRARAGGGQAAAGEQSLEMEASCLPL